MQEIFNLYDVNRNKTCRDMLRDTKVPKNNFRLVVHFCIFNSNGQMLIQQRQANKKSFANMWDVTGGGSALKGENSAQAAQRELFEELGVKVDFSKIRPHLTINFDEGFDDIYLIKKDLQISELILQSEEVKAVKWADKQEILNMIACQDFIPYYDSLITLLFDIKDKLGCHK